MQKFSRLKGVAQQALDILLPPRCAATGEIVDRQGMVSPAFWRELTFIDHPFCARCGMPFAIDAPEGTQCASCLATPFDFDRARSAVVYNDASRKIVLNFKYGDKLQAVHSFTPWLLRAGAPLLAACDAIVPVPLHRQRLWQRRFNQSAVIAAALSRESGKPALHGALLRRRATLPQKGLSRAERLSNVRGAFATQERDGKLLQDKRILLVDDVFTSGATLNECARVLRRAGARGVDVLTVARVTREEFE